MSTASEDDVDSLLRMVAKAPPPGKTAPSLERGEMIGESFRVEEQIGEGGMGVVYRAVDTHLDRPVAVKLHRGSSDGPDFARLLREAKVMAQLSHPNVVTVYEVGTHKRWLYIAMEYVAGGSLRGWLEAEPRPWRDVVRLFIEAGQGLAAAHALGLVHRDFKPDNVLLDASGRARVADFGLARLAAHTEPLKPTPNVETLDSDSLNERLTRTGAALGTPAYMAPEQFAGGEVDGAADQFSLCVALYEALYGERPFKADTIQDLVVVVALGRVEPPPDSAAPPWLRRVVLRGLKARREDRWPSTEALVAALSRDPAAKRRRVAVGVALVGAAGALTWAAAPTPPALCQGAAEQLAEVWNNERRGEVASAFAALDSGSSSAALANVTERFDGYAREWVAMHTATCEATRVTGEQSDAMLDRSMACLAQRRAALDGAIRVLAAGERPVIDNAGKIAAELPLLSRCTDKQRLLEGMAPPQDEAAVAQMRQELGELQALVRARHPAGALERTAATLERAEATGYEPVIAEALYVRGALFMLAGDTKKAEQLLDAALWRSIKARHDEQALEAGVQLAFVIGYSQHRPAEGHRIVRLAQAIGTGGNSTSLAKAELVSGAIHMQQGEYEEALAAYQRELALSEKATPVDPERIGHNLLYSAQALDSLDRFEEAEEGFRRAREVLTDHLGPDHSLVGSALLGQAVHHLALRQPGEAVPLAEAGLKIFERAFGSESMRLLHPLQTLAKAHSMLPGAPSGEALVRRAIAIQSAAGQDDTLDGARNLYLVAVLARDRAGCNAALDDAERALGVFLDEFENRRHEVVPMIAFVAACRARVGRTADARKLLAKIKPDDFQPDSTRAARLRGSIARAWVEVGDKEAALKGYEEALAVLERIGDEHRTWQPAARSEYAGALEARGRFRDAEREHHRAVALAQGNAEDAKLAQDRLAAFLGRRN